MKIFIVIILGIFNCRIMAIDDTEYRQQKLEDEPFAWLLGSDLWKSANSASIKPKSVITSCGHSAVVLSTTVLTYIYYQPTGGYGPNKRCVWRLRNDFAFTDIYTDDVTNAAETDGLSIMYFPSNTTTSLTLEKIPHTNLSLFSYPSYTSHSFLMFSSSENGNGTGFRIAILGRGGRNPGITHGHRFYDTLSGAVNITQTSCVSHTLHCQQTTIFQPTNNTHTTTSIKHLYLTTNRSFLRIFTVIPYHVDGDQINAISYTGVYPFGPPNSEIGSTEPRIYLIDMPAYVDTGRVTLEWTNP